MKTNMTPQQIVALTKGKTFTVCFTKKSGEQRILTGRTGVHKYTKGGTKGHVATFNGSQGDKGNLGVYESVRDASTGQWTRGQYRCFNQESVHWIKFGGTTYEF